MGTLLNQIPLKDNTLLPSQATRDSLENDHNLVSPYRSACTARPALSPPFSPLCLAYKCVLDGASYRLEAQTGRKTTSHGVRNERHERCHHPRGPGCSRPQKHRTPTFSGFTKQNSRRSQLTRNFLFFLILMNMQCGSIKETFRSR